METSQPPFGIVVNSECSTAESPRPWLETVLSLLLLVGVWAQFVRKLATDWSTNEQYEFGGFVPIFIVVLLLGRWHERPEPVCARPRFHWWILLALLLLLLPLRVVQEANPDWRPFNWVHGAVVLGITGCLAYGAGGWRWLRHFAAPFLLILFAIPWPLAAEQGVIQYLSRGVTLITTELLDLTGIPAYCQGNLIQVATGYVSIDDACSGIRSLAGALMSGAFFGEFFRLSIRRRMALIIAGGLLALFLNLVRAYVLSWLQATGGSEAHHRWHDRTGLAIFVVSFALLWFIGACISRGRRFDPFPSARGHYLPGWRQLFAGVPVGAGVAMIAWLLVVEAATEAWYRWGESLVSTAPAWTIRWPEKSPTFRLEPISDEAESILRYSEGTQGVFSDPGHPQFSLFYLQWAPGRTSAQLAVMHRPEICVAAKGIKFVREMHDLPLETHGLFFNFRGTAFDNAGTPFFVYRCLFEEKTLPDELKSRQFDLSIRGRLTSAWHGRRNLGQKLLQVTSSAPDEQTAREELATRLTRLIVPE